MFPTLPPQPADTPWPTEVWPTGPLPPGADGARIAAMLDHAFAAEPPADLGETQAIVVIHKGRLVTERYGPNHGPDATCWSWSMAKSMVQALVGMAVKDRLIDIHAPAPVPEWRGGGDPRGAITLDLLLRMSSGLAFKEEYEADKPSDVIEMLWGAGKDDTAAFAAGFPLAHPPGEFFYYSSGTTNIVARCLADAWNARGPAFEALMRERLLDPLGMTSARPKFDAAGTFIGSSFCFCTPRDFARFGLLYLRDGVWDGRRLLPEGWVDYARTRTYQQPDCPDGPYGAHWWLELAGPGSFSANGHDGQYIIVCPDRDLIVVRNGLTPTALGPQLKAWLKDLATAFVAPAMAG
jgi:CubicO group peptidase (beta-lactamase class C family)